MGVTALARCVGDVEVFRSEHWSCAPLLRRGAGPFDDVFDIGAVEMLLGGLARRPTFRLVRDGSTVPPAEYCRRTRVGGTDIDDAADLDRITELVADGATLVLQSLQRTWPPLDRFCAELEAATGHPVQANAYLSPGGGTAGLGRHADGHDVIVLQLAGAKAWEVAGLDRVTLRAGDVLYLPAGTMHAARAESGFSLHLTVGLLAVTRRQVLRRMVDDLGDAFDRPLPFGFADDADHLRAAVVSLVQEAADSLRALDVDAVTARETARATRRRRRPSRGRLRTLVDADSLGDDVVLRRRTDVAVTADDDAVVVAFGDRRLRMPLAARVTRSRCCRLARPSPSVSSAASTGRPGSCSPAG